MGLKIGNNYEQTACNAKSGIKKIHITGNFHTAKRLSLAHRFGTFLTLAENLPKLPLFLESCPTIKATQTSQRRFLFRTETDKRLAETNRNRLLLFYQDQI